MSQRDDSEHELYDDNGVLIEQDEGLDFTPETVQKLLGEGGEAAADRSSRAKTPLNMNADMAAVLEGAKEGEQLRGLEHGELVSKCTTLMDELARERDRAQKEQIEKEDWHSRYETLNQCVLKHQTKARDAAEQEARRQRALETAFRGRDLDEARRFRSSCDDEGSRVVIATSLHCLHPDFICGKCGERTLQGVFPMEKMHTIGKVEWKNLRELAALIDLKDYWKTLPLQQGMNEMEEKIDSQSISSKSYTEAYRKGVCSHAQTESRAVRLVGVDVMGEDKAVSDAITMALCKMGGRATRRHCVVMVPKKSAVAGLEGDMKDLELVKYGDLGDLRSQLQTMHTAKTIPKILFVMLSSAHKVDVVKLRATFDVIAKDFAVTIYFSAEVMPVDPSMHLSAAVKEQQMQLTTWRLKMPPVNMVVLSPISGLIWDHHPFANLFVVARWKSMELFEKAVLFLTEKKEFPVELMTEPRKAPQTAKRSSTWSSSTPNRYYPEKKDYTEKTHGPRNCYNCHQPGHKSGACPKRHRQTEEGDE